MIKNICLLSLLWCLILGTSPAFAEGEVEPMYGGVIIDGYDFSQDIGPKGSIRYVEERNEFRGYYNALKMPPGRRAIFAWLHDTVNQKSLYLGPVGWLKRNTAGKNKGQFVIKISKEFEGGDFDDYEIIGFTAEDTKSLRGDEVIKQPSEPSGSMRLPSLKPAFYLFAKLPGADTQLHYCGHGQDFFFAKAPEKQFCYD